MGEAFKFDLVSPERMVLSVQAQSVVVPGAEGDFTVLSNHAPVMTTLRAGLVNVTVDSRETLIFVRGGFADVTNAGVTVLAEQALLLDELDNSKLAEQIKNAEEDLRDAQDEAKKAKAAATLAQLKELAAHLKN